MTGAIMLGPWTCTVHKVGSAHSRSSAVWNPAPHCLWHWTILYRPSDIEALWLGLAKATADYEKHEQWWALKLRSLGWTFCLFSVVTDAVSHFILTAIFPGGPGLTGTRMSPFWILLELKTMEVVMTTGATWRAKLQSKRNYQQTNTQIFMPPPPPGGGIMLWWLLSVCLSVCLSVPCLTLSQELKGVANWKLTGRNPVTQVTHNPILRSKSQIQAWAYCGHTTTGHTACYRQAGCPSCHPINSVKAL